MTDTLVGAECAPVGSVVACELVQAAMTLAEREQYRHAVEGKRLRGSGETIFNNSSVHAAVLFEQLFMAARRDVKIVCRRLNPQSYGDAPALDAAQAFLNRRPEGKIEIYAAEVASPEGGNPFVNRLGDNPRVSIHRVDVPTNFDFMVVDQVAYRYEPDCEVSKALANFRDPTTATELDGVFEDIRQLISERQLTAVPIHTHA